MTLQEKELLTRFLQQFATAQAPQKDTEAEAMIRDAVSRQPDAAYLLVQRTLQLEQLLQASQERVRTLEAEAISRARAHRAASSPIPMRGARGRVRRRDRMRRSVRRLPGAGPRPQADRGARVFSETSQRPLQAWSRARSCSRGYRAS